MGITIDHFERHVSETPVVPANPEVETGHHHRHHRRRDSEVPVTAPLAPNRSVDVYFRVDGQSQLRHVTYDLLPTQTNYRMTPPPELSADGRPIITFPRINASVLFLNRNASGSDLPDFESSGFNASDEMFIRRVNAFALLEQRTTYPSLDVVLGGANSPINGIFNEHPLLHRSLINYLVMSGANQEGYSTDTAVRNIFQSLASLSPGDVLDLRSGIDYFTSHTHSALHALLTPTNGQVPQVLNNRISFLYSTLSTFHDALVAVPAANKEAVKAVVSELLKFVVLGEGSLESIQAQLLPLFFEIYRNSPEAHRIDLFNILHPAFGRILNQDLRDEGITQRIHVLQNAFTSPELQQNLRRSVLAPEVALVQSIVNNISNDAGFAGNIGRDTHAPSNLLAWLKNNQNAKITEILTQCMQAAQITPQGGAFRLNVDAALLVTQIQTFMRSVPPAERNLYLYGILHIARHLLGSTTPATHVRAFVGVREQEIALSFNHPESLQEVYAQINTYITAEQRRNRNLTLPIVLGAAGAAVAGGIVAAYLLTRDSETGNVPLPPIMTPPPPMHPATNPGPTPPRVP